MNREKRTYSGKLLDVDFYPIFSDGRRIPTRAPKSKPSTEEQEKYNHNKSVKEFVRIINTNFDEYDNLFHPTFVQEYAPQDREELKKEVQRWVQRVKRRRAAELKRAKKALAAMPKDKALKEQRDTLKQKIKLLKRPFKYAYVPEMVTYKSGKYKGRVNWHIHMFATGGLDNRTMERLWTKGVRVNCNNFQPETFGPEAAARYFLKAAGEKKKYICSRNMAKPKTPNPAKRDGKVSQYQLERWAKERVDDAAFWERRYKGYKFLRCFPRKNPFNGRWYVSLVMYRTDKDPPPWAFEDWACDDW